MESQVSALSAAQASPAGGRSVADAGVRVHCRRAAAFVPVHPGVGLGSDGGRGAGDGRLGADQHMQEVTRCACGWYASGCRDLWAAWCGKSRAGGGIDLRLSFPCTSLRKR